MLAEGQRVDRMKLGSLGLSGSRDNRHSFAAAELLHTVEPGAVNEPYRVVTDRATGPRPPASIGRACASPRPRLPASRSFPAPATPASRWRAGSPPIAAAR